RVAADVLEPIGLVDVPSIAADHRRQLHLVVELDPIAGADRRVIGPADGTIGLDEERRVIGQRQAGGVAMSSFFRRLSEAGASTSGVMSWNTEVSARSLPSAPMTPGFSA